MKEGENIKLLCQNCQCETNHKILCLHSVTYNDKENDIQGGTDYLVVSCCGCENVSLATISSCSEDVEYNDDGSYEYVKDIKQYPTPKIGYDKLNYEYNIPEYIRETYKQTCNSISNEDYILAGVGLRTIIEAICKKEKTTGRNLKNKITNLAKSGDISKQDCEILHGIRFIGNEATHEISSPTEQQVLIAIRIIENLLENKYCLVNEIYTNLDMPFRNYSDFYNFIILNIRKQNNEIDICIDELWEKERKRYYDDRINEYGTYLEKCKTDIKERIDKKDALYFDIDNKYDPMYEIKYNELENKMYVKKILLNKKDNTEILL